MVASVPVDRSKFGFAPGRLFPSGNAHSASSNPVTPARVSPAACRRKDPGAFTAGADEGRAARNLTGSAGPSRSAPPTRRSFSKSTGAVPSMRLSCQSSRQPGTVAGRRGAGRVVRRRPMGARSARHRRSASSSGTPGLTRPQVPVRSHCASQLCRAPTFSVPEASGAAADLLGGDDSADVRRSGGR